MKKTLMVTLLLLTLAATAQQPLFLPVGDVQLHYIDEGSGPPVMLIHGFFSSIVLNWQLTGMIDRLKKTHRVIAMDCRGFGLTSKPERADAYGMQMVEDVVRLMDHLHLKQCDVVGYSMGGIITMKLLATHPDRVHAAIVGGMGWLKPEVAKIGFRGEGKPATNAMGMCWQSLPDLSLSAADIARLKTPMMVVVGEKDAVVRGLYVNPLHRARPDIPITLIPGTDHVTCIMAPYFLKSIDDWLARH